MASGRSSTIWTVYDWVERRGVDSLNDNPIIDIASDEVFSSANFLGDYIAVGCDHLRADVAKACT